ncbi:MAG: transporter [Bacteroidaceae bacterium]|nr:transporter [Bacteroidaceae bacterium]
MRRCIAFIKNWTLPVAIATGTVIYLLFARVTALASAAAVLGPLCEALLPVSIFLTLFVTFAKVDFHLMRLRRWHAAIIGMQLLAVAAITALTYYIIATKGADGSARNTILVLEAVLVCIIAPCASASPVVTAKLGGDLTQMTTFVLLSSLAAALLIPVVFPMLEPHAGATFLGAFLAILRRLATVLLLPLLLGAVVRHWVRPLYRWLMGTSDLGFYLWGVSLAITSGITVRNIVTTTATHALTLAIAAAALATAVVQFRIGRAIGHRCQATICCGQAMFQKNTGLAIWIAYVYLSPLASIGAGCYVLWQNIINSYELWQQRTKPHDTA